MGVKSYKGALRIVLTLLLALSMYGCGEKLDTTVTWFDADGEVLETALVSEDYDPNSKHLPADNDLWHYTGWTVAKSGNVVACTAIRVAKTKVIWKDFDDSVLEEQFILEGEEVSERGLPQSEGGWLYTKWSKTEKENEIIFKAEREPDNSYFVANVFQIVVNDSFGEPLGVGSGFVFHKDGWFITNDHVMNNGASADAYFDIRDSAEGERYTVLKIIGGVYHDAKKDIFIGKLAGYEKIADQFKDIPFTEEYAKGDICYSIGYPNSSVTLEINQGVVQEEYSNIYDKIEGKYYILADCYIAPGSSGGILVDEKFHVIGITTMGLYSDTAKTEYLSAGSIPTYIFIQRTKNLNAMDIQPLAQIYGVA